MALCATFAVVLPIPSPALTAKPQVQTRFYRELSARIESSSSVRIIDLSPVFGKDYRNPERHLFWPNGMRLNEEGYRKVAASLEGFFRQPLIRSFERALKSKERLTLDVCLRYDSPMVTQFPTSNPSTPLLDSIDKDRRVLASLSETDLVSLADEVRQFLLFSVANTGGHFGAGLGVVELTVALHHVLNTPQDRLVWDVGHQTYPHKILTGRREKMGSIRQQSGTIWLPQAQ